MAPTRIDADVMRTSLTCNPSPARVLKGRSCRESSDNHPSMSAGIRTGAATPHDGTAQNTAASDDQPKSPYLTIVDNMELVAPIRNHGETYTRRNWAVGRNLRMTKERAVMTIDSQIHASTVRTPH
jgi:hypothetical protein